MVPFKSAAHDAGFLCRSIFDCMGKKVRKDVLKLFFIGDVDADIATA